MTPSGRSQISKVRRFVWGDPTKRPWPSRWLVYCDTDREWQVESLDLFPPCRGTCSATTTRAILAPSFWVLTLGLGYWPTEPQK